MFFIFQSDTTKYQSKNRINMANNNLQHDFTRFFGTENIPNPEKFMENPVFSSTFNLMKSAYEEMAKQANDSTRVFENETSFHKRDLLQHPNSPTAEKHCRAIYHFDTASQVLNTYEKDKVENTVKIYDQLSRILYLASFTKIVCLSLCVHQKKHLFSLTNTFR